MTGTKGMKSVEIAFKASGSAIAKETQNGFSLRILKNSSASVEITINAREKGILRNTIVLETGARATIYERTLGKSEGFESITNAVLQEGASMHFNFMQNLDFDSVYHCAKKATLAKNAKLVWNGAFFGGKTSVAAIESMLEGEGAHAENYNSFFGSGSQTFNITTNSVHVAPNTSGNVLSKGVLAGEAQAKQYGLIRIERKAAKTNCFLAAHALLLGKNAKAESFPSLEILSNDVQSRHAATADHLDEEKIFYLMTRGLNEKQAQATITEGFVGEVFQKSEGNAPKEWAETLEERMRYV